MTGDVVSFGGGAGGGKTARVERRVRSPRGGFLGVRVSVGVHGWWFGCTPQKYAAEEPELERLAVERATTGCG